MNTASGVSGVSGTRYMTKDGDMLDAICWKHYGAESAVVDVLEANPGLADHGPVLPAGVIITLPVLHAPATDTTHIRLWD